MLNCNDVESLMTLLGHNHKPEQWRLFIDASEISLKGVLLHIRNKFLSVPVSDERII
jgi:hypothetical protein